MHRPAQRDDKHVVWIGLQYCTNKHNKHVNFYFKLQRIELQDFKANMRLKQKTHVTANDVEKHFNFE